MMNPSESGVLRQRLIACLLPAMADAVSLIERWSKADLDDIKSELKDEKQAPDESVLRLCYQTILMRLADESVKSGHVANLHEFPSSEHLKKLRDVLAEANSHKNNNLSTDDWQKIGGYYDRYQSAYSDEKAVFSALSELADEIKGDISDEISPFLHQELQAVGAIVEEGLADELLCRSEIQAARQAYERAITLAVSQSAADNVRLKLASLLVSRADEFDDALQSLLNSKRMLISKADTGGSKVDTVVVARLEAALASTYRKLSDVHEALDSADRVDRALAAWNFPQGECLSEAESLLWIETVSHQVKSPEGRYAALLRCVQAALEAQAVRQMLEPSEKSAHHKARISQLEQLASAINNASSNAQREGMARYTEFMSRWAPVVSKQGSATFPATGVALPLSDEQSAQLRELYEQCGAFAERLEQGESPEIVLTEAGTALEQARHAGDARLLTMAMWGVAAALEALDRLNEAAAVWRAAADESLANAHSDDALYAMTQELGILAVTGEHDRVSALCGEAIELVEERRKSLSPRYQQSAYMAGKSAFYELGAFAAWKQDDLQLMLNRTELSKARASLLGIIASQQQKRGDIVVPPTTEREGTNLDHNNGRQLAWDLAAIERTRAYVSTHSESPRGYAFSLEEFQSQLGTGRLVVYHYWLNSAVLMAVMITHESVTAERLLFEDSGQSVRRFVEQLATMREAPDGLARMIDAMSNLLLPKSFDRLVTKCEEVIFSPHQILHGFPFHALRVNGKPLALTHAVSYAPNLCSITLDRGCSQSNGVLAVGIRNFSIKGMNLEKLNMAPDEANAIAIAWEDAGARSLLLQNDEASATRLRDIAMRDGLREYRVLHFATHAKDIPPDAPMEAYLCLADDVIDGLELSSWRLDADLVVLSACHSGRRATGGRSFEIVPGDEIFGLQAALFRSGARRVMGSLWPAHDLSACEIMSNFHAQLPKMAPAYALKYALSDFLKNAKEVVHNPYYWAPFALTQVGA